jgi:uncharacterized phage protein (TIGR02218 family)
MLALDTAIAAHIAERVTTLAVCWRIERTDGVLILGTENDRDVNVATTNQYGLEGLYVAKAGIIGSDVKSSSDISVDNMEVQGAIKEAADLSVVDLSAADIEAGLFDGATVTLFLVNWASPDDGPIILRTGTIGEITRTSDKQYRTELRGMTQKLTQNIVRTYGSGCDAELGDTRCMVDLAPLTRTGTVTAVTSSRLFTATISGAAITDEMNGGLLAWTAGDNLGFSMEVKQLTLGNTVNLYLPMPLDVQIGDTFTVRPGCDKSAAMCKGRFSNLVNFRGHGAWVPGLGELSVFGGQTASRSERPAQFLEWPRTSIP